MCWARVKRRAELSNDRLVEVMVKCFLDGYRVQPPVLLLCSFTAILIAVYTPGSVCVTIIIAI
ncbi:hypothetical protein CRENBAI_003314 [Crenichthys baileyi]|uniref:Uncharacterized protein n=1 Tax=Crenichthys baileyi TaxID=28760 RepID=A0AAV9R1I9_9TELE